MGREIRRVPENWNHPKTFNGNYQPMLDDYISALKSYKESVEKFIKWMSEIIKTGKCKPYNEVFTNTGELYEWLTEDGQMSPPDVNDYMPSGEWYQLFEDVSEGTPLSPPFETAEELVEWLSNNKDYWGTQWSREAVEDMLKNGAVLSGVFSNGKMYGPEDQYLLNKK